MVRSSPARLVSRADTLIAEDDLPLATHLIELAVAADPEDNDLHGLRAAIYEKRAVAESSLMAKGIFMTAQRESEGCVKA